MLACVFVVLKETATTQACYFFQEKIMRVFNVWAFCRDQTILDPKAAWRIIDLSSSPMEQFL